MIFPAAQPRNSRGLLPAKADRLLVGIVAGAALVYFAGRILGLGKPAARTRKSG